MKKILISILMLFLVGCATSEVEQVTNDFIKESENIEIKNNDKISESLKSDLSKQSQLIVDNIAESLHVENNLTDADYRRLMDKLSTLQSELKHSIDKIEFNKSKSKADVYMNVEYVDIGELILDIVKDSIDRDVLKENDAENLFENIVNKVSEEIDKRELSEFESMNRSGVIKLGKAQDEWSVIEIDDSIMSALTLGFSSQINRLSVKVDESVENKRFLEIESNLTKVFDSVEKVIVKNKMKINDLSKNKGKLKKSSKDFKVVVGKGDKENVYYISKGERKNEIQVKVKSDGETYRLHKKVKR